MRKRHKAADWDGAGSFVTWRETCDGEKCVCVCDKSINGSVFFGCVFSVVMQ